MTRSQSNFSQMRDFISYMATIKGDLSNMTAPPFVLSPKSVTEIPASWAAHHELFLQPAREADPARRSLLVLKNFLCSLKHQAYAAQQSASSGAEATGKGSGGGGGLKKPLNAFLGELFLGTFTSPTTGTQTRVITEQVSHHPPVTASVIYNREHGISSAGYVAQETTFSATSGVRVRQVGHAVVRDDVHAESHLRTLPTMAIRGLLTGRPYLEMEGTCYISSSSGFLTTIVFGENAASGGGKNKKELNWNASNGRFGSIGIKHFWGSGTSSSTRHCVRAVMTNVREGGKEVYEVTGQWTGKLTVRNATDGSVLEEFHVDDIPSTEIQVKPIEKQSPWESRRAWAKVAEGIRRGDLNTVATEKMRLEEGQRQIRAAEKMVKAEWPTVFFRRAKECQEFALLAKALPHPHLRELDVNKTAGAWAFIGFQAAEDLIKEGVFHRSLEPTGQVLK
ncbi:Oxysterol-binding protein [Xylariaceae sp. FL0594]|nr:Oxysterol-binding protein [Xylariaceae sp. FL0594]